MLTNAYSLIHETFPDEHYRDVRNMRYWVASRALTARFDCMFCQKTNLSENQTETIRALITSPFDDININYRTKLKIFSVTGQSSKLCMIHWKKNIFLELTELESPSNDSDYKEGNVDNLLLQRNKTEDENLVDTGKVKIEAACYFIHVHAASYFILS